MFVFILYSCHTQTRIEMLSLQADEFLNKDVMINHVKRFGEIHQNHRPNIVDSSSTLVQSVKEID